MKPKIIKNKPILFFLLKWFFPSIIWENTVISFGSKIYTKYRLDLPLYAHEFTHCEQQRFSSLYAIVWWIKYVTNSQFRLKQEIDAYRTQYEVFKSKIKDREKVNRYLYLLAQELSGRRYNSIINLTDAIGAIKIR